MTATERRYTGVQDTIVSMDDYDVYGETFNSYHSRMHLMKTHPYYLIIRSLL